MMVSSKDFGTLAAAASIFFPSTLAGLTSEWHMDQLYPVAIERLDPIVSPNAVGAHMHHILGGSGFAASYDFDASRDSSCTSASITADHSNYWAPKLYWIVGNGSYVPLPAFTRFYYKLGRNSQQQPVKPFPAGLRMLTGNPNAKNDTGIADFTCHVNSDLLTGDISEKHFNFDRDCPYGLRIEMNFPPCWDGISLFQMDGSHMAWPVGNQTMSGQCPWSHPNRLPQIMLEYTFRPSDWAPGKSLRNNLIWANGDTTGYGVHADFTNGWDVNVLGEALNNTQCAGHMSSQRIEDCEVLSKYYDANAAQNCISDRGQMNETGETNQDLVPIPSLPGCNLPWGAIGPKPKCTTEPSNPDVSHWQGTNGAVTLDATLQQVTNLSTGDSWQFLECIKDTANMLTNTTAWYYDDKITVSQCQSICLSNGKNFAAVGNKDTRWNCQCGSGLDPNAAVYPGMCTWNCPGDSSQKCGGDNIHSIYYAPPSVVASAVSNLTSSVDTDSITVSHAMSALASPQDANATPYLGCYTKNNANETLLNNPIVAFDADNMTTAYCVQTCTQHQAVWAATSNGHSCFCGANYTLGGGMYVSDASCQENCAGDPSEKCGQDQTFFSVYNLGITTTGKTLNSTSSSSLLAAPPSPPAPAESSCNCSCPSSSSKKSKSKKRSKRSKIHGKRHGGLHHHVLGAL